MNGQNVNMIPCLESTTTRASIFQHVESAQSAEVFEPPMLMESRRSIFRQTDEPERGTFSSTPTVSRANPVMESDCYLGRADCGGPWEDKDETEDLCRDNLQIVMQLEESPLDEQNISPYPLCPSVEEIEERQDLPVTQFSQSWSKCDPDDNAPYQSNDGLRSKLDETTDDAAQAEQQLQQQKVFIDYSSFFDVVPLDDGPDTGMDDDISFECSDGCSLSSDCHGKQDRFMTASPLLMGGETRTATNIVSPLVDEEEDQGQQKPVITNHAFQQRLRRAEAELSIPILNGRNISPRTSCLQACKSDLRN